MATPTTLPTTPDAVPGNLLPDMHGVGTSHSEGTNEMIADILQAWTKLGISASTPTANTVLRGTGTGTTAYGKIVSGDITDGTIDTVDLAANAVTQSARAVGSTSGPTIAVNTYANIPEMTCTLTTVGGNVEINFQGSVSNSAANSTTIFGVSQGGAAPPAASEIMFGEPTNNLVFPVAITYLITGLAAGTYTWTIQWKTDSGTATMNTTRRMMSAKEFKR